MNALRVTKLPPQGHRNITVSITQERLDDARNHGLNVSAVCRYALEAAVKAVESGRPQTVTFEP